MKATCHMKQARYMLANAARLHSYPRPRVSVPQTTGLPGYQDLGERTQS